MSKICIIGMGNMGAAMKEALEVSFDVSGCDKGDNLGECVEAAGIVILAVKPQDFPTLAGKVEIGSRLVISIMAGVSLDRISSELECERVVRVMPNLPLKVGAAVCGWISQGVVDKTEIREILVSFGTEIEVDDESKIDAITALSGSGPAYYYWMNRALRVKALEMGFSDEDAQKIAKATFLGAAELLKCGETCSGELINMIASKGGTTEAALDVLDDEMIEDAVEAAYKRAKELNDESK
jgi:pyrroline-5-carboxylate reductase